MKITDVKCGKIGNNLIIRIITDKGIDGYGEVEEGKDYIKPLVPFFKEKILGVDPTDVERVMLKIRRFGGFKPWGKVVSSIEMALWDIAGKSAGVPVYKLLGGKVRDKVRVYNGSFQNPNAPYENAETPEQFAENLIALNELPEGFSIVKSGFGYHGNWFGDDVQNCTYANFDPNDSILYQGGLLTEHGLNKMINFVGRVKEIIGEQMGLALDCGPGMTAIDALKFAKAVEPFNLMWLEDMVTGDYTPYVLANIYKDITSNTTTPIHTGEEIYLRQNFMELIEKQAINVVGPDPADVGGIAELKWIAEYAHMHGIAMAPHGTIDGVFGLAALTHVCATMPENYIAYEYPAPRPGWWFDIVDGLPDPILKDGHVQVWDKPGLGVEFIVNKAEKYLAPEDKDFFL